jgi:hypothetical protein
LVTCTRAKAGTPGTTPVKTTRGGVATSPLADWDDAGGSLPLPPIRADEPAAVARIAPTRDPPTWRPPQCR